MNYLNMTTVRAARLTEAPPIRSRSGYGNKLSTAWQVQLADKRWRRVYCVCWGNSGTWYVLVNGKPEYIASHDTHDIVALASKE
jgi:hypothetical protein